MSLEITSEGPLESLRDKIAFELAKLDVFRYVNINPSQFDRGDLETHVVAELEYHCQGNKFTNCLKNQLIDLYVNGYVEICGFKHPYDPSDIYLAIETVVENQVTPKPFTRKKSLLYGKNVFHVHHSQSFYSVYNCIRYFERKYQCDSKVWKRLRELKREVPGRTDLFTVLANEVFLESVAMPDKTGEWLVFLKEIDKPKFLCVFIHNSTDPEDSELYSLVKDEV